MIQIYTREPKKGDNYENQNLRHGTCHGGIGHILRINAENSGGDQGRRVKLPNRSREIHGFEQYTIGGKTYPTDNIRPLMAEFSGGIRAPGIQVKIGSQMVDIPLNLLFKDMRAQYESLKKEYVIPKNKNENNPEYIRQASNTKISRLPKRGSADRWSG